MSLYIERVLCNGCKNFVDKEKTIKLASNKLEMWNAKSWLFFIMVYYRFLTKNNFSLQYEKGKEKKCRW